MTCYTGEIVSYTRFSVVSSNFLFSPDFSVKFSDFVFVWHKTVFFAVSSTFFYRNVAVLVLPFANIRIITTFCWLRKNIFGDYAEFAVKAGIVELIL
jgi:hypothetical protein